MLRVRAFEQNISMAQLIRNAIDEHLQKSPTKALRLEELTFIGSGNFEPGELDPISERHDETLAEDFAR